MEGLEEQVVSAQRLLHICPPAVMSTIRIWKQMSLLNTPLFKEFAHVLNANQFYFDKTEPEFHNQSDENDSLCLCLWPKQNVNSYPRCPSTQDEEK